MRKQFQNIHEAYQYMTEIEEKFNQFAKELGQAAYELYKGYPPKEDRYSYVKTSAIRKILDLNQRVTQEIEK